MVNSKIAVEYVSPTTSNIFAAIGMIFHMWKEGWRPVNTPCKAGNKIWSIKLRRRYCGNADIS